MIPSKVNFFHAERIGLAVLLAFSILFVLQAPEDLIGNVVHEQYHWYSQHEKRNTLQERTFTVNDDIVYRYARYSINDTGWQVITLEGERIGASDWLQGTGTHTLPTTITGTGEHYIITYTCTAKDQEMTSWNCHGNETEDERGSWQLRIINNEPPERPLESSLLLHYTFDNNAEDTSGNNNHGTNHGASTTAGVLGNAFRFNGDDHVDVPAIDIAGEALTITAWVYIDAFEHEGLFRPTDADARIISKATGTSEQEHYWMISTAKNGGEYVFRYRLRTQGTTSTLFGSTPVQEDTWYHVAATYDGNEMRLYLNGEIDNSMVKTGSIETHPAAGVRIGDNPEVSTDRHLDGSIDDLRIYQEALTQERVQELLGEAEDACFDCVPLETVSIINVSASDYHIDGCDEGPCDSGNVLDGDLSDDSRWSAEGDGSWLQIDLSGKTIIDEVQLACYAGDERIAYFSLEVSTDGNSWTEAYDGHTSGTTTQFETYTFSPVTAKHVRLIGHGSNISGPDGWNSYTEIRIEDIPANISDEEDDHHCVPNSNECGPDGCGGEHPACASGTCVGGSCEGGIHVLFENDFEHRPLGPYATRSEFMQDFQSNGWGDRGQHFEIVQDPDDPHNKAGLFTYPFYDSEDFVWACWGDSQCYDDQYRYLYFEERPAFGTHQWQLNGVGPSSGGGQWSVNLGGNYESMYMTYRARFEQGFEPVSGGKLFGFFGESNGGCPSCENTDCRYADGTRCSEPPCDGIADDFSARHMFHDDHISYYAYFYGKVHVCGDSRGVTDSYLYDGEWHTITVYVRMNDVDVANGVLQTWIDGEQKNSWNNILFRTGAKTFGVQKATITTFFGGSGTRVCTDHEVQEGIEGCSTYSDGSNYYFFAPRKTERLWVDDIAIYRK